MGGGSSVEQGQMTWRGMCVSAAYHAISDGSCDHLEFQFEIVDKSPNKFTMGYGTEAGRGAGLVGTSNRAASVKLGCVEQSIHSSETTNPWQPAAHD